MDGSCGGGVTTGRGLSPKKRSSLVGGRVFRYA